MSRSAGWRPALRIARRDLTRAKARTALVVTMVALPIMLVTGAATFLSTSQVSQVESIDGRLGQTQAEILTYDDRRALDQDPYGRSEPARQSNGDPPAARPWSVAELEKLTGGRIVDVPMEATTVRTDRGRIEAHLIAVDTENPQLSGIVAVRSGRAAKAEDEVLVTSSLQERGYRLGSTLRIGADPQVLRVVGVAELPYEEAPDIVVGRPGALAKAGADQAHRYLLERRQAMGWPEVRRLNAHGLAVFSRQVVTDPPDGWQATLSDPQVEFGGHSGGASTTDSAAVAFLLVFSVMLEVVLLAGPAFAVGARRQRRALALIMATGGTARDVRRVVRAQALAAGLLASVVGAGLGLALVAVVAPVIRTVSPGMLGPYEVNWLPTLAACALGTFAALVAAHLPARAASRADPAAVLAGRREPERPRRGLPWLGLGLIGAGAALTLALGTRKSGEVFVALGWLSMVLGTITAMPTLIAAVGRWGSRLPLPLRLAARDSARHRARTAPAVAAVMASVAGVTILAITLSSESEHSRRDYQPLLPVGVTTIKAQDRSAPIDWGSVDRSVSSNVPGARLLPIGTYQPMTAASTGELYVALPGCPAVPVDGPSPTGAQARCENWAVGGKPLSDLTMPPDSPLVAGTEALQALGYRLSSAQRAVLDAGGVLLPHPDLVQAGSARVATYQRASETGTVTRVVRHQVPAAAFSAKDAAITAQRANVGPIVPSLVTTPEGMTRLGLSWTRDGGVLVTGTPLSRPAQERVEEALLGEVAEVSLYTERGPVQAVGETQLVLALAAMLAVLIGTLTATGLAMADARPDLATLASIGANPRTRRLMAAAQALVIGLLGALAGVLVGFVPGVAMTWPVTATGFDPSTGVERWGTPTLVIPWTQLLAIGVLVPLLAAAAAGLGVRSRLPMTRRLGQ